MPRKGSRVIDVDGQMFRWKLASSHFISRISDPPPSRSTGTLTVQEDNERPGHVLQHGLSWLIGNSVTPEVVREIIRRALKAGWNPASRKAPTMHGQDVDVETIETKISVIRDVMDL